MRFVIFAISLASTTLHGQSGLIIGSFSEPRYTCIHFEKYSEWEADSIGVASCHHKWVYAEYGDVNINSNILQAVYCPCECTSFINEARVCSECHRHETRVLTRGSEVKYFGDSEYKKLKKQ